MSFQPDTRVDGTAISPLDEKTVNEVKQSITVDDGSVVNDSATLLVEGNDSVQLSKGEEIIPIAPSKEMAANARQNYQPIQLVHKRPPCDTARNRMYSSQNSFNGLDFDYYDINDCSIYKNNNSKTDKMRNTNGDDLVTTDTESPRVIMKSSSSNIAMEVRSLFKPPNASSALPSQHNVPLSSQEQPPQQSLFRSTSSESISMKHCYQMTTQATKHYYEKIRVGICAMDKKAQSQPMKEILFRLDPKGMFII
jgi:hypothetical protein